MKKINKSIKLIALLVVCMAMPTLAGAQVLKNAYFNVDWQINSPLVFKTFLRRPAVGVLTLRVVTM